jgi:hypothetical protein
MTVMPLDAVDTGGIPVAPGGALGGQVTRAGQVQYGEILLGADTSARWRELVGWRDLPGAQVADTERPQAHGAYAGSVYGDALTVTYTALVRGTPESKLAALATLERYAPMDGVERPLVVDDGAGPTFRMARVIGRSLPMDKAFQHGPVEVALQFLCADPFRYGLDLRTGQVRLPESSGGLEYPLAYPLGYGESSSGGLTVWNDGSMPAPLVATFNGPMSNFTLSAPDWSVGFNLTLADGDQLVVDTLAGTALLNGGADRLYTITPESSPVERCRLPVGSTSLTLTAQAGTGTVSVSFRDSRM